MLLQILVHVMKSILSFGKKIHVLCMSTTVFSDSLDLHFFCTDKVAIFLRNLLSLSDPFEAMHIIFSTAPFPSQGRVASIGAHLREMTSISTKTLTHVHALAHGQL